MSTELAVIKAFKEGSPMQQLFGAVYEELGGLSFVVDWAEENPGDFMRLLMAANPNPQQHPTGGGGGTTVNLNLHSALAPGPLDKPVSEQ